MSKSVWMIVSMGAIMALVLVMGMMISLDQLQEVPAAEWVRLSEATSSKFTLEKVSVRVNLLSRPTTMQLSYQTKVDSKFDTSVQNAEMESVAQFAVETYKGKDLHLIENVLVTRSETHGSGCFQQTYVANLTYVNPRRTPPGSRFGMPLQQKPPDQSDR